VPPHDAPPPRLTVRPAGWEPSDAQLDALAELLLALANRAREQDAEHPAAPDERATGTGRAR
jgi:hypothetical protein